MSDSLENSDKEVVILHPKKMDFDDCNETTERLSPTETVQKFQQRKLPSFEGLFHEHHKQICVTMKTSSSPINLFVFENGKWLKHYEIAQKDTLHAITIGRHSSCQIRLTQDPLISLRHAMLILYPESDGIQYKLLDLSSSTGIEIDEHFQQSSIWGNGNLFFTIHNFQCILLVTPKTQIHPDTEIMWSTLSSRSYEMDNKKMVQDTLCVVRQKTHRAPVKAPVHISEDPDREVSAVIFHAQPLNEVTSRLFVVQDMQTAYTKHPEYYGILDIIQPSASKKNDTYSFGVLEEHLNSGILLGRYERCAVHFDTIRFNMLSRVHCLFIKIQDTCYVIDVASSNGTFVYTYPYEIRNQSEYREQFLYRGLHPKKDFARVHSAPMRENTVVSLCVPSQVATILWHRNPHCVAITKDPSCA